MEAPSALALPVLALPVLALPVLASPRADRRGQPLRGPLVSR
jgi:hypothetical protein